MCGGVGKWGVVVVSEDKTTQRGVCVHRGCSDGMGNCISIILYCGEGRECRLDMLWRIGCKPALFCYGEEEVQW